MEIWNSLDEKTKFTILVTIIIAVIGWVIAIWQFRVANKLKKTSLVYENRLKVYNEYFHKIDDINDRLMIDFQEFIGPTVNKVYAQILTDPENSNQSLIEMQNAMSKILSRSSKTITQATQELQKLRFIASKKTLKILDEYKDLAQSQINIIPELLGSINVNSFQNYDALRNQQLIAIGQKLIETRDALEKQMRKDLDID
ncbi:hypothetical protein [Catalinimonas niigatensis]|uniref:hypothetical protein n=1 Tax=Catalinimonas niigatensis TaxID=1397264 RepID=UPI002665F9AF|nr:hypothetical protein [Catalinimonas niigatensis]WPP49490.1 hypothetical protein PZB72_22730 [Catalinimonas niigatensis]